MKSESEIQAELRMLAGLIPHVRLWRNNVGRYRTPAGRWMDYGLCPGSPDLVGWKSIVIQPEHIGMRMAIFTGVEVKREDGVLSPEQQAFQKLARDHGAFSLAARSALDIKALLGNT